MEKNDRWTGVRVGDILENALLSVDDPERRAVVYGRLLHSFQVFFLDEGRIRTAEWTDGLFTRRTRTGGYAIRLIGHTQAVSEIMTVLS